MNDERVRKSKLEISLLLPEVPHAGDRCIDRLRAVLEAKEGVEVAHAVEIEGDSPGQICIHFDPEVLSIGEVRALARRTGAELDRRYGHLLFSARPMYASRASAIETRLSRTPGVLEAVVAPDGETRIEYDRERTDEAQIKRAISDWIDLEQRTSAVDVGKPDELAESHDQTTHNQAGGSCCHSHDRDGFLGEKTELIFAGLAGVFLLIGWLVGEFTAAPSWTSLALLIVAYFFGGFYTVLEMLEKLLAGKFEIDFLMLVAAGGAAILGAWAEGALLLFLFSMGHALEGYAMGRAKQAIESLAELAPRTARVRRDGQEVELAVEELVAGDVVVVKPDERVAADGFVIAGESSVDQAPITGESVPVDKLPVADVEAAAADPESVSAEHRVYAGTINQAGALEIQVTKLSSENTLARVVTMVNEAETRVSPTQQFTKKFERFFVPTVLVAVVLLLFAWLVIDEAFADSFYRAMAVLVAASPCALAISTPSAVLSGVARAARGGVLVKGGAPLESLGRLDSVAFDKTGTLTEGKPKVTEVRAAEGVSEVELLRVAIAAEDLSKHPLAQAVVRDGKARLAELGEADRSIPAATDLRSITGRGLEATFEGATVHIGNDQLFAEIAGSPIPDAMGGLVRSLESSGRTTMIVRRDDGYLGAIGLMDTPREASKRTIAKLRDLGIARMIMISGDNQQVADAVAKEVGLDESFGDLMPEDKVAEIRKLASEAGVAMVGDGVNDAPAMAAATVGIAMGAAGSDVALETADVALMADNLDHLPLAIGLSRATSRIIRQNLWVSLGMVVFLVPATILGLDLSPAVILHEGSTLVVVFNALRLLAYQE